MNNEFHRTPGRNSLRACLKNAFGWIGQLARCDRLPAGRGWGRQVAAQRGLAARSTLFSDTLCNSLPPNRRKPESPP